MSFFDNTPRTVIPNPDTGNTSQPFISISAPIENSAWNSTPVSWSNTVVNNSNVVDTTFSSSSNLVGNGILTTNTTSRRTTSTSEKIDSETTVSRATTVKSSVIPYMRSKRIKFKCTGLKPYSKLKAIFSEQEVTELCRQNGQSVNGLLVASATGAISGYFDLPGNRFKTGERLFKLEDELDANLSTGVTTYSAIGERLDVTNTDSFHTNITIQNTISSTTSTTTTSSFRRLFRDPVAQSFFVDTAETSQGVFIHSVDLFFFEIDPEHEILLEVRKMQNGYPTLDLITPYSFSKLNPEDIVASVDGSVSTRFVLQTPVYLPGNEEYCFVVLSNSEKSSIWCSEIGKKSYLPGDIESPSGELISKQPYLGTMFISQNNSTWDAQQLRDVKFSINRCKFNTNGGNITYINSAEDDIYNFPNKKFMAPNALEFVQGSKEITLYAYGHALIAGDTFKLYFYDDVITSIFGVPKTSLENVDLVVTSTTPTQIKFSTTTTANGSGSGGGNGLWIDGWVTGYSYAQLLKQDITLDNTFINYELSGKTQSNYSLPESGNIALNSNKIVDLNNIFVIKDDNDRGAVIKSTISTTNDMLSPFVYADNIGLEGHMNIINNIDYKNNSDVKLNDSSPSKYIQKEVSLINPANELKVMFESIIPFGSNVSVYYKTGSGRIEASTDWTKLVPENVENIYSTSNSDWRTQKYTKSFTKEWDIFQVMIVMYSDSRLIVPKIKNYRAIALNA